MAVNLEWVRTLSTVLLQEWRVDLEAKLETARRRPRVGKPEIEFCVTRLEAINLVLVQRGISKVDGNRT